MRIISINTDYSHATLFPYRGGDMNRELYILKCGKSVLKLTLRFSALPHCVYQNRIEIIISLSALIFYYSPTLRSGELKYCVFSILGSDNNNIFSCQTTARNVLYRTLYPVYNPCTF